MQRAQRQLQGSERSRLFGAEQRHRHCRGRASGGKNRRLRRLCGLDHRNTLHLANPTAIGLADSGQAREEGSQEKQQFQTASL